MQFFWRGSFCVLEFGWWQPGREKGKHGPGNLLGVDAWFAMHAILNVLQECAAALGRHVSGRVPAFVIQATQQWQKTCPDIDLRRDVTNRAAHAMLRSGPHRLCRDPASQGVA